MNPSLVHSQRVGIVTYGTRDPSIWIIAPNRNILGEHYGHEIRKGFGVEPIFDQSGIGVIEDARQLPEKGILVFSGNIPRLATTTTTSRIVIVSPQASSTTISNVLSYLHVTVILGEYSQDKDYWIKLAQSHPNIEYRVVDGDAEYIPNWLHEVASAIKDG